MRIVFPFFAQLHQVFHSLPIAAAIAVRYPDVQVHVAGVSAQHVAFVERLLARFAPGAKVQVDALEKVLLNRLPSKKRTMIKNRHYFRSFDAIVTPERTSLFLKKTVGIDPARLIWTRHGAGDRSIGFARDVHLFDYVLMAGRKIEERLLAEGQIRPGDYTVGVYAKFDWLRDAPRTRLFDNDRPTVLYNPHFDRSLSSWPEVGTRVLEFFANDGRWNVVFAPHVRLFDPPTRFKYLPFREFDGVPNIRIDLGSERSIDMTYLNAADLYLGDVSSQVSEFVCRPRPCLFLDAHGVEWRGNPNYRFWQLGPVLDDVGRLGEGLEEAFSRHAEFEAEQKAYVAETFEIPADGSSAVRGADAIVEFLRRSVRVAVSA